MTLHAKWLSDLKRYPWNFNLIKNVEDVVVFLTYKVFITFPLINKKYPIVIFFSEKPQIQLNSLKILKHLYLIHTLSNKAFKDKVVNQALLSCMKGKEYEIEGRYNCRGPPYHALQTVHHLDNLCTITTYTITYSKYFLYKWSTVCKVFHTHYA